MTPDPQADESLEGVIERTLFHNPETGYTVARLSKDDRDRAGPIIVGRMPEVNPGASVRVTGRWRTHPVHGRQFEVVECRTVLPTTLLGIRRYLGSGMVPGIGPKLAERLVDHFGDETLEVIDERSARLKEVDGIGPKRIGQIREAWQTQKSIRGLMIFLEGHGLGRAHAMRVYRAYGPGAEDVVRANPYRLAREVHGIGFLTADRLAQALGIAPDAPERLRAGVAHVLQSASEEGHCCLTEDRLVEKAVALLDADETPVRDAMSAAVERGELAREEGDAVGDAALVFLPQLREAERCVAACLLSLLGQERVLPEIAVDRAVRWAQRREGIDLEGEQRDALRTALSRPMSVMTGGPGVGKTTIVRCVVSILRAKKVRIALAAPTGRAARRLADAAGYRASTIHRLLKYDPAERGFVYHAERPLPIEALIVDESSMIDIRLMADLLSALPRPCWLLLVGDADQLPSVGPGDALRDILRSRAVATSRLTTVFRQRRGSAIVENAHRINRGEPPDLANRGEEFFFVAADDPEDAREKAVEIVTRRIPQRFGLDPMQDVQVLAPMVRGPAGVERLNAELQERLNPQGAEIQRYGRLFRAGDRVMQRVNDYDREVFNGDVGRIRTIDEASGQVTVMFEDRPVEYEAVDLDALTLAYAATVHKSQGSEYPAVVVMVVRQHAVLLERNLLYTAVTRARRLVVMVGQREAVDMAVRNVRARRRWTRLAHRLRHPEPERATGPLWSAAERSAGQ